MHLHLVPTEALEYYIARAQVYKFTDTEDYVRVSAELKRREDTREGGKNDQAKA